MLVFMTLLSTKPNTVPRRIILKTTQREFKEATSYSHDHPAQLCSRSEANLQQYAGGGNDTLRRLFLLPA